MDRRDKLIAWRKATGRTPMKKLSYIQEYHHPSPKSSPFLVHPKIQGQLYKRLTSTCSKVNHTSRGYVPSAGQRSLQSTKKFDLSKRAPKQTRGQSENKPSSEKKLSIKKPNRREMLEQWLATHGSVVKRPRSVLQPLNVRSEVKPRPSLRGFPYSPCTMRRLKEQLQREIEEDCREDEEEQVHQYDDQQTFSLARELDFNESGHFEDSFVTLTPTPSHKVRSRRSCAHDPGLMFHSSTIRYSMSVTEPRKRHKRRHTVALSSPERRSKRLVYLTPVRRSTRRNKCDPSTDECVDSPGQVVKRAGFADAIVEVLPNQALDFDDI